MNDPSDMAVEAVARALCRERAIQNIQQGDAAPDLQPIVDLCWRHWEGEAKVAIAAYEKAIRG